MTLLSLAALQAWTLEPNPEANRLDLPSFPKTYGGGLGNVGKRITRIGFGGVYHTKILKRNTQNLVTIQGPIVINPKP